MNTDRVAGEKAGSRSARAMNPAADPGRWAGAADDIPFGHRADRNLLGRGLDLLSVSLWRRKEPVVAAPRSSIRPAPGRIAIKADIGLAMRVFAVILAWVGATIAVAGDAGADAGERANANADARAGAAVQDAGGIPSSPVIINEIVANATERSVRVLAHRAPVLGSGFSWVDPEFDDSDWDAGRSPMGFGYANLPTDLSSRMRSKASSIYLRRTFHVTAGEIEDEPLRFRINFNDGFIAFLNGVELCRRRLGGEGSFVYHDQTAYERTSADEGEGIDLGPARDHLKTGINVIAVQVHNRSLADSTLYFNASLVLGFSPEGRTLAGRDPWRYRIGFREPSGGVFDPTLTPAAPERGPAWTDYSYDDAFWAEDPGGIGIGDDSLHATMMPVTPGNQLAWSLYLRKTFHAAPEDIERGNWMRLRIRFNDGFLATLNGTEIARQNLGRPGDPVAFDRPASQRRESAEIVEFNLGAFRDLLDPRRNVLCIQVHRAARDRPFGVTATLEIAESTPEPLVRASDPWRYFVGLAEPDEAVDPAPAEANYEFHDWIELYNRSDEPVSLAGWALTDDASDLSKWIFPEIEIGPRRFLLVAASGLDRRDPGLPLLHTNFRLATAGEYLALSNGQSPRTAVHELNPGFPRQSPFHSYGRVSDSDEFRYLELATPGAPNISEPSFTSILAAPSVSPAQGFYDEPIHVRLFLENADADAEIRYTLDGSEPTETNGTLYSAPILVDRNTPVRARAFKADSIPSSTSTRTYLIGQPAALRSLPALCVNADDDASLFKPFGAMAIVGGFYEPDFSRIPAWWPLEPEDYNHPMRRGRAFERSASVGVIGDDGHDCVHYDCGLRVAGSDATRRHYREPNGVNWLFEKWGMYRFNLFFRNDYGPLFHSNDLDPLGRVHSFSSLRLNSAKDPKWHHAYKDELARRLFSDLGRPGAVGQFANLFLNGEFKGYYMLINRIDEAFLQQAYDSGNGWDIVKGGEAQSGDMIAWNRLIYMASAYDLDRPDYYRRIGELLDIDHFIDYLILHDYTAASDWPRGNYIAARERSDAGKFLFFVWDADQSFSEVNADADVLSTNLSRWAAEPISILFRGLRRSAEFRLRFADRIQKHFFNGGALTDHRVFDRYDDIRNRVTPVTEFVYGKGSFAYGPLPELRDSFLAHRRDVVLGLHLERGFWPYILAPVLSMHGGQYRPGEQLEISNPNAAGTVWITLDGRDPRAPGGAVQGRRYSEAIRLEGPTILKARVWLEGEWSPLTEALFEPRPSGLVISELMYHFERDETFPDRHLEFVELENVGEAAIDLGGAEFVNGIDFLFPPDTLLGRGGRLVLTNDADAFARQYPGRVPNGVYDGRLSNGGERLTLVDRFQHTLVSLRYEDADPWPVLADGDGYSLVLDRYPSLVDLSDPALWRSSSARGGSPLASEPPPPLTYDRWLQRHFNLREHESCGLLGKHSDHDGDGLSNFLEYAHGTDPRIRSVQPPVRTAIVLENEAAYFEIAFRRLKDARDIRWQIDLSTNLTDWESYPVDLIRDEDSIDNGDGTELVFVRAQKPVSDNLSSFFRLGIIETSPPNP